MLVREAASRIGFPNFKPQQLEAMLAFCKGKDVCVSHPTGFGKMLIFAVPPLVLNSNCSGCESPSSSDGGKTLPREMGALLGQESVHSGSKWSQCC